MFWTLFQLSKKTPIQAINPFAEDPYDAVASIAFQVALLLAVLNVARLIHRGAAGPQGRYIMRGNLLIVLSIAVTLVVDMIAIAQKPGMLDGSIWSTALIGGMALLATMMLISAAALIRAQSFMSQLPAETIVNPRGVLADAIEDIFVLITWPAAWLIRRIGWPKALLVLPQTVWIRAEETPLFGWVHPRQHPWRFAVMLGLGAGIGLSLVHFFLEGGLSVPTAPLNIILLISAIFIGIELAATLAGYLLFGGYLGLRPPLRAR
jgi:hypothetical protein